MIRLKSAKTKKKIDTNEAKTTKKRLSQSQKAKQ
jgi:hypothetical protein